MLTQAHRTYFRRVLPWWSLGVGSVAGVIVADYFHVALLARVFFLLAAVAILVTFVVTITGFVPAIRGTVRERRGDLTKDAES
jgi:hypothetical protein